MTLYDLKPRFQALLRPLATQIAARGITANQVTLAAAAGSVAVAALVALLASYRVIFLLIPFWLFARMALNAIDGMLAREFNQQSRLGAYLNELCDVVSDAALYAPFALVSPFGPFWIGVVIVLSLVAEYAGVMGPLVGAGRRYDGPLGKSDRALLFGALGLCVGLYLPLPDWLPLILVAAAGLLAVTVVNRVRRGLAQAPAA